MRKTAPISQQVAKALEVMGEQFTSTSSAAVKVTGRPMNGWDFWQCKMPGKSEFVRINTLRPAKSRSRAH